MCIFWKITKKNFMNKSLFSFKVLKFAYFGKLKNMRNFI